MFLLRAFLTAALTFVVMNNQLYAKNKIVYLISPARCLSTVFLRSMHARGDFTAINDPALRAYWSATWTPRLIESRFRQDSPKTFAELKQVIFKNAQHANVIIKDMSFSVENFLLNDKDFVKNKDVHFVFLLRNPHHATISLYNASKNVRKTVHTKEAFASLIGYQSSSKLFDHIKKIAANAPCIVLTEDLYTDPKATMQALCDHLKIPFTDKMLKWESLDDEFLPTNFLEFKQKDRVLHWHATAMQSTCFKMPTPYGVDLEGNPSFEEITDPAAHEFYRSAYLDILPFYKKFFSAKNAPFILQKEAAKAQL